MPKNHTDASTSAATTPPLSSTLPERLTEILSALPFFAWVENPEGEILTHNRGLAGCDQKSSQPALAFRGARASRVPAWASRPSPNTGARRDAVRSTGDARAPRTEMTTFLSTRKLTTYPLPPLEGSPRGLRLVALVSGASQNDCHARVVSALLAILLGVTRADTFRLTPQQRAIYGELSRGSSHIEAASNLGISHNALRVQLTRMRKRLGNGIIPRLRAERTRDKKPLIK